MAAASGRMIVIADESKWVPALGRFPLPIEVVPFGLAATRRAVEAAAVAAGCPGRRCCARARTATLSSRMAATGFSTPHSGGFPIRNRWPTGCSAIPGVVEHGLFIGLAQAAILAGPAGVRVVERP